MRPATLITSLCALGVSVSAFDVSSQLGQFTSDAAGLKSSLANANPTSLYNSFNSEATQALVSLSKMIATASGPEKTSLQAAYTSAESLLSKAHASASTAGLATGNNGGATTTGGNGGAATGSTAAAASGSSSGMAAATGLPIAAGALGGLMAVVAVL